MKRALFLLLAACGESPSATPDAAAPPIACTGEPPPVGAAMGEASSAWRVTATSGTAFVGAVIAVEGGGAAVIGTYEDGLAIGGHSLEGTGTYIARVSASGEVTRLARLSTEQLHVTSLATKNDAIYAAVDGTEDARIARIDATDTLSMLVTLRGAFNHTAQLAATSDGVILSAVLAFGTLTIDGGPSVTPQTDDPFAPGHGVAVRLADDGTVTAWHLDGDAGSSLAVADNFVTGRFGGFGPLQVHFGPTAESPRLTAVSSDDDPAFDAYVAGRSGDGVTWAHRIRAYTIDSQPPPHVTYEGDLLVAIAADGYDIVFRDGEPDAVTVGNDAQHALGRFSPDGTVRWARESLQIDQLWTAGCALYAIGTDFATQSSYLARFDGEGAIVGRRTYAPTLTYGRLAVIGAGSWILAGIDDNNRLGLTRLDW